MSLNFNLILVLLVLFACQKRQAQQITWAASSHWINENAELEDSLNLEEFMRRSFYLSSAIRWNEFGNCIRVKRQEYLAPRQYEQLELNDSLWQVLQLLLQDSMVFKTKQMEPQNDGEFALYCGFQYSLSWKDAYGAEKSVVYIPPYANESLLKLHSLFLSLLDYPTKPLSTHLDTLQLDSEVYGLVKALTPAPRIQTKLRFIPPEIHPEKD